MSIYLENVSFNYEWLLHIGASTKTNNPDSNAGYFGEGFKIASLCALRDYQWDICMSSGNWTIKVVKIKHKIDKTDVDMLAYEVFEHKYLNKSKLTISKLSEEVYNIFLSVLKSFFYPENPLFGKKIWEGNEGAVYVSCNDDYDSYLPYTYDFGRKGTVFCSYQLLGSNPFGLAVCLHSFKKQDRERHALYDFDVVDVFERIADIVDAKGAMFILEKMRRNWNTLPEKRIDIDSWYPVVNALIRNISHSITVKNEFKNKYPNILYLIPTETVHKRNQRNQAKAWLKNQTKKYILVQKAFSLLGYPSLEEECEKNGGFVNNDLPDKFEENCFLLLENLVKTIYNDFFDYKNDFPKHRIIRNLSASFQGMASTHMINSQISNNKGIKIRNRISEIYLKATLFRKDTYYNAVATIVHELCHAFGSDSSASFSYGLTCAMEILIKNSKIVEMTKLSWEGLFLENSQVN